jgi:hypothetical protein
MVISRKHRIRELKKYRRILICPLEWGLGHAGRCLPLAAELKNMGHEIIFAAGEKHLAFLRVEFPDARFIVFPGFNPSYSRFIPMWMVMAIKSPCLFYHIIREHFALDKIIRDHNIDAVISDNRLGLWNAGVKSVYITHQLRIIFPKWTLFCEPLVAAIHRWFIKKYDYCLVPDLEGENNVSGKLSHGLKFSSEVRFIGLLSRFWDKSIDLKPSSGKTKDYILLILSGPEPQKTIFKDKVVNALVDEDVDLVILGAEPGGGPGETNCANDGHVRVEGAVEKNRSQKRTDGGERAEPIRKSGVRITYYDHLPMARMRDMILNSGPIIARSGYTSIMELLSLGRSALLVPTPGQTEQEYLAKRLSERGWFTAIEQNKIGPGLIQNIHKSSAHNNLMEESRLLLEETLKNIF